MDFLGLLDSYHVPTTCKECGGVMVYRGIGDYQCEDCGFMDQDDYGKARSYIEKNPGATAMDIENATGVPQKSIRKMLRESRLEVAANSKVFLHCERCGKEIRSGQYCDECEIKLHRNLEEQQRQLRRESMAGYGMREQGDEGRRRFIH